MRILRQLRGVALLFGLLCLLSAPALARIGGGQHYTSSKRSSSRSSSHSSSYGSHGSGFHFSGSSSRGSSGGGCGLCCVLILVGGIVLYVLWSKKKREQGGGGGGGSVTGPMPSSPNDEGDEDDVQSAISALKAKDPAFDLGALYQKASDIFLRSQKAWSDRQLQPVRAFMSDATFQRFETQLELMRAQNVRNVTADQKVEAVQMVGFEQNPHFDTVHLAIRARMRDVDVPWNTPDADAQARAQRAPDSGFVEIWSFVRKPGTKTDPGKDLLRGKCPNCGAPFTGGAANTCEFCGAVVNSGNYDWTLAEITQAEEHEEGDQNPPGSEAIRQADPAFSVEILEDRTSLIFWKWIEAHTSGQAQKVAKVATPEYLSELQGELGGQGVVHRQCAVGAVITRDLEVGPEGTRATVEVLWSSDTTGGDPESHSSMFYLARGPGAQTNAGNGMSTARCPNCNAPLTASLSSHCDFCGTTLGGNPNEWLLAGVQTDG